MKGDDPSRTLFTATRRLLALEHFRTPYRVSAGPTGSALEELRPFDGGPGILWPSRESAGGNLQAARLEAFGAKRIPLFASVVADDTAQSLLAAYGGSWIRAEAVTSPKDEHLGALWRRSDGSVFLPFDPDQVQLTLLSEAYKDVSSTRSARRLRRLAMRIYYGTRGFTPKPIRIWMRQRFARVQARSEFPRWPVESGLHDFLEFFHSLLEVLVDEPVPRIAPWPNGATWALVLTHDVETSKGAAALDPVIELERSLALRSSWNFVPKRYDVDIERVRALWAEGFEVGVHGLYHDGRDLESAAMLRRRLPFMREAAERWEAVGFRSPATHRVWELMPTLGFDYDSSYLDTDPFEPQNGGCCSWLPFFNQNMVELPMTLTMDHTLFVILNQRNEQGWIQKAEFLKSRGGMALINTHPDYFADTRIFRAYRRFLERFADDPGAWKPLPREASAWWRRRSESTLERSADGWKVVGPAAGEARIEYAAERAGAAAVPAGAVSEQYV